MRRSVMASFHAWWSLATILGAIAASIVAATSLSLLVFFAVTALVLIPVGLIASTRFVRGGLPTRSHLIRWRCPPPCHGGLC